ncbi:MAG: DUF2958 domain-containing protein [Bacteroidetes bacterium]|nr:DUF2958 domain-containing protein [Bacteroidota bacterium]
MELFTKEQLDQLYRNGSPMHTGKDHFPVIKLFIPDAQCTWLITEMIDDETLFGLCDLGMGVPELGYVNIEELKSIRGPLKLKIERDLFFEAKHPLSVYTEAARWNQLIVCNEKELLTAKNRTSKKSNSLNLKLNNTF